MSVTHVTVRHEQPGVAAYDIATYDIATYDIPTGAQQSFTSIASVPHGSLIVRTGPHQGKVVVINHHGTVD